VGSADSIPTHSRDELYLYHNINDMKTSKTIIIIFLMRVELNMMNSDGVVVLRLVTLGLMSRDASGCGFVLIPFGHHVCQKGTGGGLGRDWTCRTESQHGFLL
jgi:hypothetical protein